MKRIMWLSAVVLPLSLPTGAHAQKFEHLSIHVEGRTVATIGGEQRNTWFSTQPTVIGQTDSIVFAKMPDMCGFAVSGGSEIQPGAIHAWNVNVTPVRVEGESVTFRVRWVRSRDNSQVSTTPNGDVELTLRPGESLPLDMVPLSPTVKMPYEQCHVRATVLRVGVSYFPGPDRDARLLQADLWLVEKMPDGSERNQPISLRGQFHKAMPFYFDPITDGAVTLEFYGELTATSPGGPIVVKLETRSRLTQGGQSSTTMRFQGNMYGARKVESTLRLNSDDVAAVELPKLSENEAGAFANRTYSIRVRTRQIR
jgi:hypothetical protein